MVAGERDVSAIWVGPPAVGNYEPGRRGNTVEEIVLHWTTASLDSTIGHFLSPTAGVSAHYIIDRDGLLYQMVDEKDTAYHAGDFPINLRSIGIEHVGGPAYDGFTDEQYATSHDLVSELAERFGFLVSSFTVFGHRDVVPTQCPGVLDLERVRGGGSMVTLVSQSADLKLVVGEVGVLTAGFSYNGGAQQFVQEKVYAPQKVGRYFHTVRPPADPNADPTRMLGEAEAKFVIDVRAS